MTAPVAVHSTGLVTSVGLSAPAACAAIRAGLTNASQTRFVDSAGEWIVAHSVDLGRPLVGLRRLAAMAAMAIDECLSEAPTPHGEAIPIMLCVAERERPGRAHGLNEDLLAAIQAELSLRFSDHSLIVPQGRVGVAVALDRASRLIHEKQIPFALIAAVDSLLSWATISHYERAGRLLTTENSNGFIVGEGAGALLIRAPAHGPELLCTGVGLGHERSHIDSNEPLRAEGLTSAIKMALSQARLDMGDMTLRVTDLSGEQYYFKEASLAVARTLKIHKEEFPLWHPAECIGEQGATAGVAAVAVANAAFRKGYAGGSRILAHMANDAGQRAALTLEYGLVQ